MNITQIMILVHHLQHQHLSLSSHPLPPLTVHIIHHIDILHQQSLNIIPLSPAKKTKTKNRAKVSLTSFSGFPGILTDSAPPLAQSPDFWNARSPAPQFCCGKAATANGDYRDYCGSEGQRIKILQTKS